MFVERLWKSAEEVYMHGYDSVAAAKTGINRYFMFYHGQCSHTALDRNTPDHVYFESQPPAAAAQSPNLSKFAGPLFVAQDIQYEFAVKADSRKKPPWTLMSR